MSANKRPFGYWKPFTEAVLAMQLNDPPLVWDMDWEQRKTAHARLKDLRTTEFHVFSQWYDGRLYVVRVL